MMTAATEQRCLNRTEHIPELRSWKKQ